jgi:hypothetical protein
MLGSALVSEGDGADQSLTFEKRGPHHFEATSGLPRPVYLVAVASDQPVADVPDSLYIETAEIGTVMAAANAADAAMAELTGLRARVNTAERAEAEARGKGPRPKRARLPGGRGRARVVEGPRPKRATEVAEAKPRPKRARVWSGQAEYARRCRRCRRGPRRDRGGARR